VLTQTHRDLEVVVSDDASPEPETELAGREFAAADERVRYARQPRNLGHAGNYQSVLDSARGEYFMWLADDDWLDPEYVERCLEALQADRGLVLVCGLARYYRDGRQVIDERPTDLLSRRPGARVARYFSRVSMNGPLFGLTRTERVRHAGGFPEAVGGDWSLVSALAAAGRIRTLPDVHIHRSMAGLGDDPRALAESFGLTGLKSRRHHAVVAARLWRDIAARDPAYARMPCTARLFTASLAAALVLIRFPVFDAARVLLNSLGLGHIEDRVIAWARARER